MIFTEKTPFSAKLKGTVEKYSYLKSINADYIDETYQRYLEDPTSVDDSWKFFFEGIEFGAENFAIPVNENGHTNGHANGAGLDLPTPGNNKELASKFEAEARVGRLIMAYRERGYLLANLNPLDPAASTHPLLELSFFGFTAADLETPFAAGNLLNMGTAKLKDIIAMLKDTYCGSIGAEFTHIQDQQSREWVALTMEATRNKPALDVETKKFIYKRLAEAEGFERFLHTRYVAQKRFSVEGGEGVIPMLDCMVEIGAELGAKEVVMGMAHRGRLNVLTHIFGKKPEYIFTEFEGSYKVDYSHGEGDVKYHKGYSADFKTRKGKDIHLSLANNPSHLEFVNAIVEGVARAKQAKRNDQDRTQVIPILIHGDAAFAGQGVCYEVIQMSELPGYETGGTIHIVINNQVGFTTDSSDARSTRFSTDLAKMLETPIFHVNGDNPEAIWHVSKLATEYRQKFRRDVFIDLICFRKHGHNEGDEPSFTQPVMYQKIKAHPGTRAVYAESLAKNGVQSADEAQGVVDAITEKLTQAQSKARAEVPQPHTSVFTGDWEGYRQPTEEDLFKPVKTSVSETTLKEIANHLNHPPASFKVHSKLTRFLEARWNAVKDGKGIDWGNAESLAYGSLVFEGHPVRLSGQDAERGTFTHRHAVLSDSETGQKICQLDTIPSAQARFMVHNSHLSETGVMGFEHGYALAAPNSLVIWEAQFGDFSNGAQVIIDQFFASSESKWQRMHGLVLLLPHGYEGQGPEHSSARLERFLQLCGRSNMFVANLTTPAQIFHALRRQVKWDFRKPLVIMSPKSLLRHPQAISTLDELSKGGFHEVIDDVTMEGKGDAKGVKRVLLCSGKIYYDLAAKRAELKRTDIAIIRVEQIYPFPAAQIQKILTQYGNAKDIVWVQEEPRNMGAWMFVFGTWMGGLYNFAEKVGNRPIRYVGREIGASPAVGSIKLHEIEQKTLVEKAFQ